MKNTNYLVASLLVCLFLTSCVSNKKYDELRNNSLRSQVERDSLRKSADANRYMEFDLKRAEGSLKEKDEEFGMLKEKFVALEGNYKDLLDRYDELIFQNQTLLSSSSEEVQNLHSELSDKQLELDKKERELRNLELTLQQKENQLNDLGSSLSNSNNGQDEQAEANRQALLQCEQQLNQLTTAIQAKDATLTQLRSRINQALLGFSSSDLSVSESNGRIYVTLNQNLLYAPNSDKVDWKGKQAIQKLVEVLKRNPDIQVNVEGHTDSDGSPAHNWDLSVRRAVRVASIMTGYGLNPKRVTASGRSEFLPIATNSTAAGKSSNRRTEIILTPKLDELYKIINQ